MTTRLYRLTNFNQDIEYRDIGKMIREVFEDEFEGEKVKLPESMTYGGMHIYNFGFGVTAVSYSNGAFDGDFSLAGKEKDMKYVAKTVANRLEAEVKEVYL